ncbi:hypothetical protein MKS88_001945 [Plasmodium brasilianum]|uniref:Uncharacterized protein n=1 Tax=Plasmodium brasilianum TaxID=5824 RepID=A0ACB9YB71_PLABR|nr:hypothetical protein MKS88_001945 [Plasmodium brasilianum]
MMPISENNNDNDDWELHPLFLSKIPNKKDIDKNHALSALITLINEEEEKEVFNYEPRRKNLKKKITEKGEIIYKKDRRNFYEPYQNIKNINNFEKQKFTNNVDLNKQDESSNNAEEIETISNVNVSSNNKSTEETSIGEVLVCLSMINLK